MNLIKAIDLGKGESVVFVGAGGKTSTMFALAKELEKPVILTATTHLGAWQSGLADVHYIVQQPEDIDENLLTKGGKILFTGPEGDDQRLHGLAGETLAKLQSICKDNNLNLLIEGDGARQRAIKAPAEYEPVIPMGVDRVILLAGLSALGKPLVETYVHRPEIFSSITGLALTNPIRVCDVIQLLESKDGGLKGIPIGSEKILFLNQADDDVLSSKGGRIARRLTGTYDRILIGSIEQPGSTGYIQSVYSQTAGVILAAGGSERLQRPKQLLDWHGKPFIRQVAETALEAGLAPLIVITGANHDQVTKALSGLPVQIHLNPNWKNGQSTSVRLGINAVSEKCNSALFLLCDQPQLPSQLIIELLDRFRQNRMTITAPMVDGQRGNPLLFSREAFSALAKITGDRGGRTLINLFTVDWLSWIDGRILLDVDKPGDYERLLKSYSISE